MGVQVRHAGMRKTWTGTLNLIFFIPSPLPPCPPSLAPLSLHRYFTISSLDPLCSRRYSNLHGWVR